MADTSFFDGFNADKVLGFGLEAYASKVSIDQAKATKASADATAARYASLAQKTVPANGSIIAGVDNKVLFGGGVLTVVVLLFLAKGL